MNVLIIEDEVQTAWDLQQMIHNLQPNAVIVGQLDSIESGVEWFSSHPQPDLIFSDIQLGDGLVFELFSKLPPQCPVIFCTAYDEYAIEAFKNCGIDYLLKPIEEPALAESLAKLDRLKVAFQKERNGFNEVMQTLAESHHNSKSTFLVNFREKIIPLHVSEIACFQVTAAGTSVITKDNRRYVLSCALDAVESSIDPKLFYRANRQFLVKGDAVKAVENYFDRKLLVELSVTMADPIIVSKAKATDFLRWLENR
jgi:two-component system, LytTR family, response regulator LytT